MNADELERIQRAADKRRRKLERYTSTPAALKRRAEQEAEPAAGVPTTNPPPAEDQPDF